MSPIWSNSTGDAPIGSQRTRAFKIKAAYQTLHEIEDSTASLRTLLEEIDILLPNTKPLSPVTAAATQLSTSSVKNSVQSVEPARTVNPSDYRTESSHYAVPEYRNPW